MNNLACSLMEVKFSGDQNAMTFSGYGAVFGNVDSYGDVIAKGAFRESLGRSKKAGDWPAMLSQHGGFLGSDMTPVGLWTDMYEDESGLRVEGKLAPTPRGQELYALMKMEPRPAISGLSIGYQAKEWSVRTRPEEPRRTLKSVELLEVSIVTKPANPKARITGIKAFPTIRDFESFLRDVGGFSNAHAKRIASHGYKSIEAERDAGDGQELGDQLHRLLETIKS
jgi:HK97 family phage prohead protease